VNHLPQEVLLVDQMTKAGKNPQEIREAIVHGDYNAITLQ
jgi:hypothetical protein